MRFFNVALFAYVTLWILLRVIIFNQRDPDKNLSFRSWAELEANSDRYDCQPVEGVFKVTASGRWLFQVFFINAYEVVAADQTRFWVYTRSALPREGRVFTLRAVYRQFAAGTEGVWSGLVEDERIETLVNDLSR